LLARIGQTKTMEKYLKWLHTQKTLPHAPATTTNQVISDANGQKSRSRLSDVSELIDQKDNQTITTMKICINTTTNEWLISDDSLLLPVMTSSFLPGVTYRATACLFWFKNEHFCTFNPDWLTLIDLVAD
jgi:hypothetical protein